MAHEQMALTHKTLLILGSALFVLAQLSVNAVACIDTNLFPASIRASLESKCISKSVLDFDRSYKIAVIATISAYASKSLHLPPAERDREILSDAFSINLKYDEVIVLNNSAVTRQALALIFQQYIPGLASSYNVTSVFAYSGHGLVQNKQGYLLLAAATEFKIVPQYESASLSYSDLRAILSPTIATTTFMTLINACKSGDFFQSRLGGYYDPALKTAVGITAGDENHLVFSYKPLGSGSVFFEVFDRLIKTRDGSILIQDQDGRSYLLNYPIDNGVLTFVYLASLEYAAYEIIERNNTGLRPEFGSLTTSPTGGMFEFIVDKSKYDRFMADYFNKGPHTSYGDEVVLSDPRAPDKDYTVVLRESDWVVIRNDKDKSCAVEASGSTNYNKIAESIMFYRMPPLLPYINSNASTFRIIIGLGGELYPQYLSIFDLHKMSLPSNLVRLIVQNTAEEADIFQVKVSESFKITSFDDKSKFINRLRNSNSLSLIVTTKLDTEPGKLLEDRLGVDARRALNKVIVYNYPSALLQMLLNGGEETGPISLQELSIVTISIMNTMKANLDRENLPDADKRTLLQLSKADVREILITRAQGNVTQFEDNISLVGMNRALKASKRVCGGQPKG